VFQAEKVCSACLLGETIHPNDTRFAVHHMCLEAQLITKADRPLI
jgi:hypothetical protein